MLILQQVLVEWAHDLPRLFLHIKLFGYSIQISRLFTEITLTQII